MTFCCTYNCNDDDFEFSYFKGILLFLRKCDGRTKHFLMYLFHSSIKLSAYSMSKFWSKKLRLCRKFLPRRKLFSHTFVLSCWYLTKKIISYSSWSHKKVGWKLSLLIIRTYCVLWWRLSLLYCIGVCSLAYKNTKHL